MDLTQLHYFIKVVEEKSFTRAAEHLHISQPSLSISIKKLENHLGISLVHRKKPRIQLTREGEILYYQAKKIINQMNDMEEEMKRLRLEGPLELSISMIETAKNWFSEVIKKIKADSHDIHIQISELLSLSELQNALLNYEIHYAITNYYIDTKELESIFLYEENLVALIPAGHPLHSKAFITMEDLRHPPFILCKEGYQTRNDILKAFQYASISPNIQFEIERFETAYHLVESGLGITIVPENYVNKSHHSAVHIKKMKDQVLKRNVYLVKDRSRYLSPIIHKSIETICTFHKS
ncbi:LysR family transcriptional regulator [Oceanobacillus sojae]|uniref:LysR family transcriptional regulator n=1 Tax=Oceanobacillus sojae TaxID=582851 RepID=UPI0009886CB0|nr:LysR family transcriptional regulator [Oceanobacillus sojae]